MVDCANRTVRRILEVGRRFFVDWVLILWPIGPGLFLYESLVLSLVMERHYDLPDDQSYDSECDDTSDNGQDDDQVARSVGANFCSSDIDCVCLVIVGEVNVTVVRVRVKTLPPFWRFV